MLKHHPNSAFTNFRRVLRGSSLIHHGSSLSRVGASGKPGAVHAFAGLELGRDAIPDETTILNFRHLLERHELMKAVFAAVAEHLEAKGALLRGGTIIDATQIATSPSTKNKAEKRDPEMS